MALYAPPWRCPSPRQQFCTNAGVLGWAITSSGSTHGVTRAGMPTKGLSPNSRVRWNRIEHRLFAFITQNWRGKPLLTHQVIVQLIASTTTRTGLTVQCRLNRSAYAKGVRVSDAEMATLNLRPAAFHGDWNYTIRPRQPTD